MTTSKSVVLHLLMINGKLINIIIIIIIIP